MPASTSPDATTDVVARLLDEGPIGMTQGAKYLGTFREGKSTHPSTIARWATRGIELPDGRVLRLESFRLNGRLCTSKPAIVRFIRAQQQDTPSNPNPAPRSPAARSRAAAAAAAELDALIGGTK